MQNIVKTACS